MTCKVWIINKISRLDYFETKDKVDEHWRDVRTARGSWMRSQIHELQSCSSFKRRTQFLQDLDSRFSMAWQCENVYPKCHCKSRLCRHPGPAIRAGILAQGCWPSHTVPAILAQPTWPSHPVPAILSQLYCPSDTVSANVAQPSWPSHSEIALPSLFAISLLTFSLSGLRH